MNSLPSAEPRRLRTWGHPSSFLILLTGELNPLVSPVYLWEQPEETRLGMPVSLEEQILNSTFEACDPQRTGGGAGGRDAGDQCRRERGGGWELGSLREKTGLGPLLGVLQEQSR